MTRHPLDVDLDVWAGVEDGIDVVNDLEAKVLSWGGVGFEASAYCCLVVDKDPNGPGAGVVLRKMLMKRREVQENENDKRERKGSNLLL